MKSVLHRNAMALALGAMTALPSCAGTPVPNNKIASSEAAVRAAKETGSRDVPQAALHLKLAEEQLESAKC